MPRRRRDGFEGLMGDAVDMAVDGLFDRATDFVDNMRRQQQAALSEEQLRQTFTCAACRNDFSASDMEMVHLDNGFGLCRNCFKFVWQAGKEKIARLSKGAAKRAATAGARQARQAPQPQPPPGPPVWEVLGLTQDATVEQIKRAYRKLAMQWHPDRVPPGASSQQKEQARAMFEQITRARDVMMKVRSAPTG
jgi:hypothetical protein